MSYSYKDARPNYDDYMLNYLQTTDYYNHKKFKCRNPYHNDSNPSMGFNRKNNKVHCFSCGCTYNLIDLIMIDFNCNYPDALNYIRENFTNEKPIKINIEPKQTDFRNYYYSLIEDYSYLKSRGINEYIQYRFGVRFDRNNKSVIITNGYESYTERFTEGDMRYKHYGSIELYNKTQPLNSDKQTIIVEGEIDCLSVYEALGYKEGSKIKELEYNCIALGSANNWYKLVKSGIDNLIIALDNDDAGKNATELLSEALTKEGRTFKVVNLYENYKDANDILLSNIELFKENIKKIKYF